jgi:hypothetical protein
MTNERSRSQEQYILACFLTELVASELWKIMGDADRREIITRVRIAIADGKKECLTPTLRGSLRQLSSDVILQVFPCFDQREKKALRNALFGKLVSLRRHRNANEAEHLAALGLICSQS